MPPQPLSRHAETIAATLRALGPRHRARVLLMLRALGLSDEDAAEVVELGLGAGLFVVDADDPLVLKAPP